MRTWQPDTEVDLELATRLIGACFPEFAGEGIEYWGRGWDNAAFLIRERSALFRFPIRRAGAELVEIERALLPIVARHLDVPVPEPRHWGQPAFGYPYPFTGFRFIPGVSADSVQLAPAPRRALEIAAGRFLRRLHAIPAEVHRVRVERADKTDPAVLRPRIVQRLNELVDSPEDHALGRAALARFDAIASRCSENDPARPVLCHGDFYPRHVLLGPDHGLAGVIDWGDSHFGSPAADLSAAWTLVRGREGREAFWEGYGQVVHEETLRRARLRAILYGFALAAYGLAEGDVDACATGREALTEVADE